MLQRYAGGRQADRTQSAALQHHSRKDVRCFFSLTSATVLILKCSSVADIIRSCLGPKAMLKMLLDPMGGIVLTNDGHAILREIEVAHPAAKSMIELSRTQDEEVGDGTTTVIILGIHPSCCPCRGALTLYSWRDPCTSPTSTRTQHPPCRHHLRLQASTCRRPRHYRRNLPARKYQR